MDMEGNDESFVCLAVFLAYSFIHINAKHDCTKEVVDKGISATKSICFLPMSYKKVIGVLS